LRVLQLKAAADVDALRFITRYRAAYDRVTDQLLAVAPATVLRFSTAGAPPERTADEVAIALEHVRAHGSGRAETARGVLGRRDAKSEAQA
jgi:hypothetical protein